MRALRVREHGEPIDVLRLEECAIPEPATGQVLVRVLGSAANFADVLMCRGQYQDSPDFPFTPGIEACGEVVALGSGTSDAPAIGTRVVGTPVIPAGGFAEYALMDARLAFEAPQSLDDASAAALYIGYQTGWFALHRRISVRAGQTLLVHAAAGGVGTAAIQLGRAAGMQVIAVVSNEDKARIVRELGADHVIVNRRGESFVNAVKEITGGCGADVIFDPVGGETYALSTKCIAFEGSILVIGFAGGEIQKAALNHALVKNYSIVGLYWGAYRQRDPLAVRDCHRELMRLANAGQITPLVSETMTLEEFPTGLQRLADGMTTGRIAYLA